MIFELERQRSTQIRDLDAQVSLYCGAFETVKPAPRYFKTEDLVQDMRRFASRLRARRYASLRVSAHVVADEDHFTVFPAVATRSLLRILPGTGPYTSG